VFFDNVGGQVLDAALENLAKNARYVLCGAISSYNGFEDRPSIKNYFNLVVKAATMRGFLIFDYVARAEQALGEFAGCLSEGRFKSQVDVVEGLENAPHALRRLFTGENLGKQLVKIADPIDTGR
jgi:NADPH-dependent curcumin reductase CurA